MSKQPTIKPTAKHVKWQADEVTERMNDEFTKALADFDALLAQTPAALADFDRLAGAAS